MSNLLQKASIITTPTAYNDGKLLSVKPVEYYGPELVTNGDFATNSDWVLSGLVTIANGVASFIDNGTNGNSSITQNILTQNKTYKITFDVTRYVAGNLQFVIGSTSNSYDIRSGVGSYVAYYTVTSGVMFRMKRNGGYPNFSFDIDNVSVKEVLNADFDFTRNSSATRVGSNGLIQDVASNLPRIDYSGGVGSWKFEPQRTNLVTYSESFSNSYWSKGNSSITSNSIISPDGSLNADKLTTDSSNATHYIDTSSISFTSGVSYTVSIFVKNNNKNLVIQGSGSVTANAFASFDLKNGVVINESVGTGIIKNFGNDWYRCSLTFTSAATTSGVITFLMGQTRNDSYQGDGTSGLYIYGAQLESGSYPTSYIKSNTGSATTRLADVANNAGSSDLINSTQGVLYADISALADDGTYNFWSLNNLSNKEIDIGYYQGFLSTSMYDGTTFIIDNSTATLLSGNNKAIIRWVSATSADVWLNGSKVYTYTGTIPTYVLGSLTNLSQGDRTGNFRFYGNTKSLAVFKEALSDLELECLVSWMSFSDLGINFGYTVE